MKTLRKDVRTEENSVDNYESTQTTGQHYSNDNSFKDETDSKGMCFVIMPFGGWNDNYWETIYKEAIQECSFTAVRADNIDKPSEIMFDIWENILKAKILIADLSNRNPNVFYELGLAHAIAKPVILITSINDEIPFDLHALRHIRYDRNDPEWGKVLKSQIKDMLNSKDLFNSIPHVFREHSIKTKNSNNEQQITLSEAIEYGFQGLPKKIDHLRIFAHSTDTIYPLIKERLKQRTIKQCEIILRQFDNREQSVEESESIKRNIKKWKTCAINELKIYGFKSDLTEYYIIINDSVLISGTYYIDNEQPSKISFENLIYLNSLNGGNKIIEVFVTKFDNLKKTLSPHYDS